MIIGVGIDIVEIARMRALLERKGDRALSRLFTPGERRYAETHPINVKLAEALGYDYQSGEYELIEDGQAVPVLASLQRDGNPYLWIVEAPWADEDHEPLRQRLVSHVGSPFLLAR